MLIRFASDHIFAFPASSVFVSGAVTGPVPSTSTGLHNAQTRERVADRKFARQLALKAPVECRRRELAGIVSRWCESAVSLDVTQKVTKVLKWRRRGL